MTRLISCRKCGKVGPKATCDACALPVKRERARVREQSRPTPSQRGYGTDWRRLPDFYHWVGVRSGAALWPADLQVETGRFAH